MNTRKQLLFGATAVVGIVGLYFAWNFYSGKKGGNVVLEVNDKEPENEVTE